jgi:hypothetical protein
MIAFSSKDFDLSGHFYFKDGDIDTSYQEHRNITRRVSRTKTLDGGVYISDSGVSVGDKDITILIKQPTELEILTLKTAINLHSNFNVSTNDGNYLTNFVSMKMSAGDITLLFYVKESI